MIKKTTLFAFAIILSQTNFAQTFRLNQLGYYSNSQKAAIITESGNRVFEVINSATGITEIKDSLSPAQQWSYSGETVCIADFSKLTKPGIYTIKVGKNSSQPFSVSTKNIYSDIARWTMKSFYLWRSSSAIDQPYAQFGKVNYARTMGHADNKVIIHSSAATPNRPAGTIVSAPKGWYDAGDYNLYTVNASLAVFPLLQLYENYSSIYDTLSLNIPESNNNFPDLLDEIKWETDWLLGMINPEDGSVYHKLTSLNFSGMVMPSSDLLPRYMVGRSTTAALDFAAMMAKASRTFKKFNSIYPGYADSMLRMAVKAYNWAKANPNNYFTNPAGVSTGGYGDSNTNDEFIWAQCELFLSTGDIAYLNASYIGNQNFGIPTWGNVNSLGLFSLYQSVDTLNIPTSTKTTIINAMNQISNGLINTIKTSAYRVPLTNFAWGSNGYAAMQGMVLLETYKRTKNRTYLDGATAIHDYLLGKNATGYCFVSGFGQKFPLNLHDRRSVADAFAGSLPGYLAGGPTTNEVSDCGAAMYPSTYPAKSYTDANCSYSTNEIAVNWQGPMAYLSGAIDAELNQFSIVPDNAITDSTGSKIFITFPTNIKQGIISLQDFSITTKKGAIIIDSISIKGNVLTVNIPSKIITADSSDIKIDYAGTSLKAMSGLPIDTLFSITVNNAVVGAKAFPVNISTNNVGDTVYLKLNKKIAYIKYSDISEYSVYCLGMNIIKNISIDKKDSTIILLATERVSNNQTLVVSYKGNGTIATDSTSVLHFEFYPVINNGMPPLPKPVEISTDETGNTVTIVFDKPIVMKNSNVLISPILFNTRSKQTKTISITNVSVKSDLLTLTVSPRFVKYDSLTISYKSGSLYSLENDSILSFKNLSCSVPFLTNQDTFVVSKTGITKFEGENYAYNNGFTTETCTDSAGTLNLAYVDNGDWVDYFIDVKDSGNYILSSRIASTKASSIAIKSIKNQETKLLSNVSLPVTGAWQKWITQKSNVTLDTGIQILRVQATNINFNINWFNLEYGTYVSNQSSIIGNNNKVSPIFFPNPSNGILHLKPELMQIDARFAISDINGHIIFEKTIDNYSDLTIYIKNKGVYFVTYYNGNISLTNKLIIQ